MQICEKKKVDGRKNKKNLFLISPHIVNAFLTNIKTLHTSNFFYTVYFAIKTENFNVPLKSLKNEITYSTYLNNSFTEK